MTSVVDRRRRRAAAVGLVFVAGIWAAPRPALAEIVPQAGPGDPRITVARYEPDQGYRLRGIVGYQIDIEFAPGERFVGLGSGDVAGLAFSGVRNHLFLKPKATDVATNITVLTNRRTYQFAYTVEKTQSGLRPRGPIYVLEFQYPPRRHDVGAAARRLDRTLRSGVAGAVRNTDYWYCGDPSLEPTAAWDDGVHTHLRFPAHAPMPAIFVGNDDGSESLLNFSIDRGVVILDRIARRFVLRRGRLSGCIVNEGYHGGGVRLRTETLSPSVQRVTRRPRR